MLSIAATRSPAARYLPSEWPPAAGNRVPHVPGYHLLHPLGSGRRSTAWLARHESTRRELVLKLLPARDGSLWREYRIAQRVAGPHIVRVHGCGKADGFSWLAVEHVTGGSLRPLVGQGATVHEAHRVIRQSAAALAQLHRRALVHRDLKPENLLLRACGEIVLTDFGLAASVGETDARACTGALVGTPRYIAPEQLQGAPATPAADVYSLGVLLHELLCGRPPFAGETVMEVLAQHLVAPLPRLPAEVAFLQPLLDRMLAKEVQNRLPDADAVLGLLGQRWSSERE
jgi:serine/threonine-protein kinase PpkA